MSASNQPGGGFSEVKGYNPPAGTMADDQRRQREADEARRREESARQADRLAAQQREQDRARQNEPRPSRSARPARAAKPHKAKRGAKAPSTPRAAGATRRAPARPIVRSGPWNPVFGMAAFIGVTAIVASRMTGENRWIIAGVVGLFAGYVLGKLWKQTLGLAAVGGGLWLLSRSRPPADHTGPGAPSSVPDTYAAPSTSPPVISPEPEPIAESPAAPAPLPDLAGYLFLEGDVVFEAAPVAGQGPRLTITHTPYLDHSKVRWMQYYRETGLVIVVLDGATGALEHYDLGVRVPADLRESWRLTLDVTLVHRPVEGQATSTPTTSYPLAAPAGAP